MFCLMEIPVRIFSLLPIQALVFRCLQYKPFENTVGVGEIARPFPPVFSTGFVNFLPFSSNLKLFSVNSISLEESKIFPFRRF